MSTDLLRVENLLVEARVDLPGGPARQDVIVDDVSFTLRKGKVLGLIGESGAGKSTIGLAALAYGRGSVRITGGSARLGEVDILALAPRELRALRGIRIAYVAQSAASAFNPAKRLGDQMTEAAMVHGVMTQEEAETRARDLFGILGLPDPGSFGRRYPHQVSGGQLQRAMTAMALLPRPDLIVFDEPTTALDVTTQIEVLAAIRAAIAQTHTAAIYITHDLAVVAQIADDIMVLRGGRMVEYGPTRQIVDAPREDYTRRLLSVHRGAKDEKPDEGARVLSIEGVTASYGRTRVLDDVTLDLRKGRTLAIVGESGSGKSTLARVVTGLLRPDQGQVLLSDNPLSPTLKRRSRNELRQIQMIYQQADTAMNPRQTVGDIIGRPLTFYFGMRGRERAARIRELLDEIEMGIGYVDRYPAELSGGQKQRVAIARALAADPQVVLCDEPTSALDPLVAEGILNLLARLQAEKGVSYLFITHDIATVRAIADTVAVMHRGRILRFGPRERVFSPPYDDYTARLLASVPEMRVGWLDDILAKRDASAVRS